MTIVASLTLKGRSVRTGFISDPQTWHLTVFPPSPEQLLQLRLPVLEDRLHLARHQQPVRQRSEGWGVVDVVDHHGAVAGVLEGVLVDPEAVGTLELLVDEAGGGLPGGDSRPPLHR